MVVDCLFLAVFVALHGGPQGDRAGHPGWFWLCSGNGSAVLWRVLRFIAVPRRELMQLLEAMGMPEPIPYATEEAYAGFLADKSHPNHELVRQAAETTKCPWGTECEAPPTLAACLKLSTAGPTKNTDGKETCVVS